MSPVQSILEYFRSDSFNRATLGLDRYKGGRWFIYWRMSDVIFLVVLILLYPVVGTMGPFQRQFSLDDISIQHPFADVERVTNIQLFLYSTWFPMLLVGIFLLVLSKPSARVYTAYVSVLSVFLSVFATSFITDLLKNHFGRPRPDFLARCIPAAGTPVDELVLAVDVCTTDDTARLLDGFRSTPLGHSSLSFAGLLFTSLWICGQLKVTLPQVGAWRWAIASIPTIGAMLIALSRTQDYRHHFGDVFLGLVLGSLIAVWLYFRIFPLLTDPLSYQPKLFLLSEQSEPEYNPVSAV